jgi:hypothetical protein
VSCDLLASSLENELTRRSPDMNDTSTKAMASRDGNLWHASEPISPLTSHCNKISYRAPLYYTAYHPKAPKRQKYPIPFIDTPSEIPIAIIPIKSTMTSAY